MELLLKLLLSHVIGDFLLQPSKWVLDKERNKIKSLYLYLHLFVHFITLIVVLQFDFKYWLGLIIIIVSHFIIDFGKVSLIGKVNKRLLFIVDQVFHILIIVGVVYIYSPLPFFINELVSHKLLLLAFSIILLTNVSSTIIKIIISRWNLKNITPASSLRNAGLIIGILERLFVFTFVITSHWEGIGFLLAAKSVFRFGDLSKAEDRKLTEYVLIGTMLSFGLAMLVGIMYLNVLSKI